MNRTDLKQLRLYLLLNPADEPLQQPLSAETYELTAFLRGLNQKNYEVGIYTLVNTPTLQARLGLSTGQFPVITFGTDILCTGISPSSDELSALLRLGCESTGEESSCCSEVNPLREQAAKLQAVEPKLPEKLAAEVLMNGSGKPVVLFVCCHNSCRSQMAEAFLRQAAGDRFEVQSCGLTSRPIHPLTFTVMEEAGIELRGHVSKDWRAVIGRGGIHHAIFVCDVDEAQCPRAFPFALHYHRRCFNDPAAVEGSREAQLDAFRRIRNEIKTFVETLPEKLK